MKYLVMEILLAMLYGKRQILPVTLQGNFLRIMTTFWFILKILTGLRLNCLALKNQTQYTKILMMMSVDPGYLETRLQTSLILKDSLQ